MISLRPTGSFSPHVPLPGPRDLGPDPETERCAFRAGARVALVEAPAEPPEPGRAESDQNSHGIAPPD